MLFFERCTYLNLNPVLLACYFQYWVEIFFKAIHGPLGKVKYHTLRVESQVCRSPHVYSFSWIIDDSEAKKQAVKKESVGNKSEYDKMKSIAKASATKRECFVQKNVYILMPELWLRKLFPQVILLNSNLPEKRYRMFKKKAEIDELLHLHISVSYAWSLFGFAKQKI